MYSLPINHTTGDSKTLKTFMHSKKILKESTFLYNLEDKCDKNLHHM